MLSLYSLIWTFLISCPMLLLIFILRRRSDYLTKYGVTFISILYIFCTVRMLFPIEFPSHQKVICDPYLYSFLMNLYAKSEDIHKKIVMAVILTIWIIAVSYTHLDVYKRQGVWTAVIQNSVILIRYEFKSDFLKLISQKL